MPKKLTIAELDRFAASKGARLIDRIYVNSKTLMKYVCANEHEFSIRANDVKSGHWCPYCAGVRVKDTLAEVKHIARAKGGECLSMEFIDGQKKLLFRCAQGHEWEATSDSIRNRGDWCAYCAGVKLLRPMDDLVSICAQRGGICLDKIYVNNRKKMTFRCANNHEWNTSAHSIRAGYWCAVCVGLKIIDPLAKLRELARERSGECLSETYINSNSRILSRCSEGHVWSPTAAQLFSGQWCPRCGVTRRSEKAKSTLEDMIALAAVRGGKCLSTEYVKTSHRLDWKCADGHRFSSTPASVVQGQWCPACRGPTEALVRQFMECVFGGQFPQTTPPWLKEKGYRLDGYLEKRALAFEYHGKQHIQHVEHFHRGERTLSRQQRRDEEVRISCAENSVLLIEIWPLRDGYSQAEFVSHLVLAIAKATGEVINREHIDKFLALPFGATNLIRMRSIAKKNGGECLSNKYLGALSNLIWRCANGHIFESKPASIISQDSWCKKCAATANGLASRHTLEKMQAHAMAKGGSFLSPEYTTSHDYYLWQCAKGHRWEAKGYSVHANNTWCPYCAGLRREDPLGELQKIAKSMGGECLANHYVNTATPLEFQCMNGHVFKGWPRKIRMGSWCPRCGKRKSIAAKMTDKAGSE